RALAGKRAAAPVRDDRLLRRLHDVLRLQPGNADAGPRRNGAEGADLYWRLGRCLAARGMARPCDGGLVESSKQGLRAPVGAKRPKILRCNIQIAAMQTNLLLVVSGIHKLSPDRSAA